MIWEEHIINKIIANDTKLQITLRILVFSLEESSTFTKLLLTIKNMNFQWNLLIMKLLH